VCDGGVEIGTVEIETGAHTRKEMRKNPKAFPNLVVQQRLYCIRRDVRGVRMRSVRVKLLLLFLRRCSSCRDGGGSGGVEK